MKTATHRPSYFEKHFALISGQFTPPAIIDDPDHADTLVIRDGAQRIQLDTRTIHAIEAAGDYMCFSCSDGKTHVVRKTMKQLEGELDPEQFIRIHRSNMVNKAQISEVTSDLNGEVVVRLKDGQNLKVSRRYRSKIASRIPAVLLN